MSVTSREETLVRLNTPAIPPLYRSVFGVEGTENRP